MVIILISIIGPIISAALGATILAFAGTLQRIGVIGPILSGLLYFIAF